MAFVLEQNRVIGLGIYNPAVAPNGISCFLHQRRQTKESIANKRRFSLEAAVYVYLSTMPSTVLKVHFMLMSHENCPEIVPKSRDERPRIAETDKGNAMVKKLALGTILFALSLNMGHAAEPELYTCAYWPQLTPTFKAGYVFGWVGAVDSIAKIQDNVGQFLWPKGYGVSSVVLEMDDACNKLENHNQKLGDMMLIISATLNGVGK